MPCRVNCFENGSAHSVSIYAHNNNGSVHIEVGSKTFYFKGKKQIKKFIISLKKAMAMYPTSGEKS